MNIDIRGQRETGLELCLIHLGDGPNTQWLFVKLFEYFFESASAKSLLNYALCGMQGVGGSVGMQLRHDLTELIREDVGP
jgi:hypothetical protein